MMENGSDSFKESAVKGFCNSVMLWSVVGGESTLGAFLLEKFVERVAGILTTTV